MYAYMPQLGTYPIGNDTTARQEPMPLENSGNMFFMMLGIVQQVGSESARCASRWVSACV